MIQSSSLRSLRLAHPNANSIRDSTLLPEVRLRPGWREMIVFETSSPRSAVQKGLRLEEFAVSSDASKSRTMTWGIWIVLVLGVLLFLQGAERFVLRHRFGVVEALYCCLAIVPAGLLLLVFDYVLHHARLVSVIPLLAAGVLAYSSPSFEVALGLALMGAVAGPALEDWRYEKRLRNSTTANPNADKEHK
jgi:hypothetical protein